MIAKHSGTFMILLISSLVLLLGSQFNKSDIYDPAYGRELALDSISVNVQGTEGENFLHFKTLIRFNLENGAELVGSRRDRGPLAALHAKALEVAGERNMQEIDSAQGRQKFKEDLKRELNKLIAESPYIDGQLSLKVEKIILLKFFIH